MSRRFGGIYTSGPIVRNRIYYPNNLSDRRNINIWRDQDDDGIPDYFDREHSKYNYSVSDDWDRDGTPNWRDPEYLNMEKNIGSLRRYNWPDPYPIGYSYIYPYSIWAKNYMNDPSCNESIYCTNLRNNKDDCRRCVYYNGGDYECANALCDLRFV